ncbi:retrovirus-related pol polyprotein from transposon TNT 1-94 [Tanacetum coccineum]
MDSLDLDGENRKRTRLRLFQFCLRDQASNWLKRLPIGSITTWEDLTTRFLAQFFPPRRTAKLRNDILMFQQHHGETLLEEWTCFKDLLQKFPHHGIDLWLQASSRTNESGSKWYTFKPEQNNIGDTYNLSRRSHPNLRLVPQSFDTEVVCTKGDDGEVMFIEIIRKNDDSREEGPKEEGSTTIEGIMRSKLDPREDANRGVSNFTGRIKGMHVFIGNFTYVIDFMIVEDISSIIDPRLSQVVLRRPFVEMSNMTHDPPEGVVRIKADWKMFWWLEIASLEVPQKEDTFQVVIDLIKNSKCFKAFTISTDVPFMEKFWYTIKKVQGTNSYEFLLASKKCVVNANVFWTILDIFPRVEGVDFTDVTDDDATLAFLIELGYKGPLYKHTNMFLDHMHHMENSSSNNQQIENVDYPELIWEDLAFLIDHRKEKRTKRKNIVKGHKEKDYRLLIGRMSKVSEESDPEPPKRKTASRRVVKKKVTIFADDNIISNDPNIALELGKSISKIKVEEAEAERLKGVPSLTLEEQEAVDIMQSLKERVPEESTVISATLSKGTGTKPGVPNEEKYKIHVRKDVDAEMADAETVKHKNKEKDVLTDAGKPDVEKNAKERDMLKRNAALTSSQRVTEFLCHASRLSISSGFGYSILNSSFGNFFDRFVLKETQKQMRALDRIHIQQDTPMIHSPSVHRPPTPDLEWNKRQNNPDGDCYPFYLSKPLPLQGHLGHLTIAADYFFNNDLEYLKSSDPERTYTTSITKTKEARYEIEGIEDMVPTLWSPTKVGSQMNKFSKHNVYSTKKIMEVKSVSVKKLHGYGYLEELAMKRVDCQLYKFKEGDFVDLQLNDIEDILLFVVQHKLIHLTNSDIVDFIIALRMFPKSLVIKKRVEDLQLGVESYQIKLNITPPQ